MLTPLKTLTPLTSLPGYKTVTYDNARKYYEKLILKGNPISNNHYLYNFNTWLKEQDFQNSNLTFHKRLNSPDFVVINDGGTYRYGGDQAWFVGCRATVEGLKSGLLNKGQNNLTRSEKYFIKNVLDNKKTVHTWKEKGDDNDEEYDVSHLGNKGCGTTAAANLTAYAAIDGGSKWNGLYKGSVTNPTKPKSDFLKHMLYMCTYLYPGIAGIPAADAFLEGIKKYLAAFTDFKIKKVYILPGGSFEGKAAAFVQHNIEQNRPVACLHWVASKKEYAKDSIGTNVIDGYGKIAKDPMALHWITLTEYLRDSKNAQRVRISTWGYPNRYYTIKQIHGGAPAYIALEFQPKSQKNSSSSESTGSTSRSKPVTPKPTQNKMSGPTQ